MKISNYKEGLDMKQFDHIPQISQYNHNYYVGFDKDLLYAESDDDNTTTWYVVNNVNTFIYLGDSYCTDGDFLHLKS